MNNIDIANGIIFKKMKISKETFDDRIISQKKIFLLQSLGTDLGYIYNWYLRGPYSPALTNYIYTNIELLDNTNFDNYMISKDAENNIKSVNDLQMKKPENMQDSSWYELLASLLYIEKNRESWKIGIEKESLFNELIKHKPQFDHSQCDYAYSVLREFGFLCEVA